MSKLLIIDDHEMREALSAFLKTHAEHVLLEIDLGKDSNLEELKERMNLALGTSKRLAIQTSEGLTLVNTDEIVRIEGDGNYTMVYLDQGKVLNSGKSLKDFEVALKVNNFLRIHHSHLINIRFLSKYLKQDGGVVLLTDGTQLPVAQRKREAFLRLLSNA